jgi:phenylalanyl-tRNA synthetase alpha chain
MESISEIAKEFESKLASAKDAQQAEALRIEFLGRKGKVTLLLQQIGNLPPDEKRVFGQQVNALKNHVEQLLQSRLGELKSQHAVASSVDETLPGVHFPQGSLHPITKTIQEFVDIFMRMGFEVVDGREIESERYNFTALNVPLDHPARDAFDTFYTKDGHLLRSQTSTVQVRVMENRKPPLRIIAPGRVYRPDEMDASHSFMFHQIEGFMVDEHITFGDLKGVLLLFLRQVFGKNVKARFRPHFFPFTEPSVEIDVAWTRKSSGKTQWLEILGAGSIHPNVFNAVGYAKNKYRGFAFGMGVERMAMLQYSIQDIRLFYENNLQFLRQF